MEATLSPRLAEAIRSVVSRASSRGTGAPHERSLLRRSARPNTAPGHTRDLGEHVARLPASVSIMRSATPRFRDDPFAAGAAGGALAAGAVYDTDTKGPKATLATEVARSARTYTTMRSSTPRFSGPRKEAPLDADYDADSGVVVSLAKEVSRSPRKYTAMRSRTPRFESPRPDSTAAAPHLGPGYVGVPERPSSARPTGGAIPRSPRFRVDREVLDIGDNYDLEKGPAASLATAVARSPKSCAPLKSTVPRFQDIPGDAKDPLLQEALARIAYDTDDQLHWRTLAKAVEHSPRTFKSIFESETARFAPDPRSFDPYLRPPHARAEAYPTDAAHKMTLATAVARSANQVSVMRSASPRFHDAEDERARALGPGAYNPVKAEHVLSTHIPEKTLPIPTVPRFIAPGTTDEPTRRLGSNFSMERESHVWTRPGTGAYVAQAKRQPLGKPSENDALYNTDAGEKASISKRVATSPRKYSVLHSGEPRHLHPSVFLANDPRLTTGTGGRPLSPRGPGAHPVADYYDAPVTMRGDPVSIGVREPTRPTSSIRSRVTRFAHKPEDGDRMLREMTGRLDYHVDDHLTIKEDVHRTGLAYSGAFRGLGRDAPVLSRRGITTEG